MVSVIIPAFNADKTLAATLASVQAQSFPDFECWVVDDGSTDDTAMIAHHFAGNDKRFRVISQSNRGVARARNAALAKSKGQFIAALDADDLWHPDYLQHHVTIHAASPEQLGFTYCFARTIDMGDKVTGAVLPYVLNGRIAAALRYHNVVGNPSMTVLRRDAVALAGGYDPRLQDWGCVGSEDWFLLLKIADRWPVQGIPLYLCGYREGSQSMSTDRVRMARSCQMVEQIYAAENARHPLPSCVERWQRSIALLHGARHDLKSGHLAGCVAKATQALVLDPVHIVAMVADAVFRFVSGLVPSREFTFAGLDPGIEFKGYRSRRPFCHLIRSRRLARLLLRSPG